MIYKFIEELAVKGICQLIKDTLSSIWKRVKKRLSSDDFNNKSMTPPGGKSPMRHKNDKKKSWSFKIIFEKG